MQRHRHTKTLPCLFAHINTDCLLIDAARAHVVNEQWVWRMADKLCARSNLPTEAHSAGSLTFQALCRFCSFCLSLFLLFWLPITEVNGVLNCKQCQTSLRCTCMQSISMYLPGLYHVFILPVPTLVKILN